MRGRGLWIVAALAVCAAAAGLAIPATASAGSLLPSCGTVTQPFAPWGDTNAYCAFPNLGFESGSSGWTLTGSATVVAGNEPWNVSKSGSHSLQLAPGATALSSPLPVSLLDPWVRFFAKSAAANGALSVQVRFQGKLGNLTGLLNIGSLSPADYASWRPTQPILSVLAVPLGTTTAQVYVRNQSSKGNWVVDDFYLDPCASKFG